MEVGTSNSEGTKKKEVKVRKAKGDELLREITVKIGLERIDTQEGVMVEALLDSGTTRLVMSLEFTRKQGFKLKKIDRLIYVRNMDGSFNQEEPIEHTAEVNIYYQEYRKQTEIDMIEGQKWSVILGMSWLTCYNLEINWKTEESQDDEVSTRM